VVLPGTEAKGRLLKSTMRLLAQSGNRIEADLESVEDTAPRRRKST
jgi:hypothetical protein